MALAVFNNPSPNLILSNDNTRAVRTSNTGPVYQRCSVSNTLSGKVYFEIGVTHAASNTPAGVVMYGGDKTVSEWPVSDAMGYWWDEPGYNIDTYDRWSINVRGYNSDSNSISIPVHLYDSLPPLPSQVRYQIAVDATTREVWVRTELNSSWVGGGNPAIGTSPTFVVGGSSPIWVGAVSGNTGSFIDLIAPGSFIGATPSGFTAGITDGVAPSGTPSNIIEPIIVGTPAVGATIGVNRGNWSGAPSPVFTYQWVRNGTTITGATGTTYIIPEDALGDSFHCIVTATNTGGTASAPTNIVTAISGETARRIKPITNYDGEFSIMEQGDAVDTASGGTGLTSFTGGSYFRALNSSTMELIAPSEVRSDISAKTITFSGAPPTSANEGDEWVDVNDGTKYTYTDTSGVMNWVEMGVSPKAASAVVSSGNIDGGTPYTNFGGITGINGGKP